MAVGLMLSTTVTLKEQGVSFCAASVTVTCTGVVPTVKKVPDAGTLLMVSPGQLSLEVTVKLTRAPHCPGVLLTVMLAGQLATGSSVSLTVTVKLQVPVLDAGSVAENETFEVPTGKVLPLDKPPVWETTRLFKSMLKLQVGSVILVSFTFQFAALKTALFS